MLNIPRLRLPYQDQLNRKSLPGCGHDPLSSSSSNRSFGVHYAKDSGPVNGGGTSSEPSIDKLFQDIEALALKFTNRDNLSVAAEADILRNKTDLARQFLSVNWTGANLEKLKTQVKENPLIREFVALSIINANQNRSNKLDKDLSNVPNDIYKRTESDKLKRIFDLSILNLTKNLFFDQNLQDSSIGTNFSSNKLDQVGTIGDFITQRIDQIKKFLTGAAFSPESMTKLDEDLKTLGLSTIDSNEFENQIALSALRYILEREKLASCRKDCTFEYHDQLEQFLKASEAFDYIDERTDHKISSSIAAELVKHIEEYSGQYFIYPLRAADYLARSASKTSNIEHAKLAATTAMNILKDRLEKINNGSTTQEKERYMLQHVLDIVIRSGDPEAKKEILEFMRADQNDNLFKNVSLPTIFVERCKSDEMLSGTMLEIALKEGKQALPELALNLFGPLDVRDVNKLSQLEKEKLADAAVNEIISYLQPEIDPGRPKAFAPEPISPDQVRIFKETLRASILDALSQNLSNIKNTRNLLIGEGDYNGASGLVANALEAANIKNDCLNKFLPVHWNLSIGFEDERNISEGEKLALFENGPNTEYSSVKISPN